MEFKRVITKEITVHVDVEDIANTFETELEDIFSLDHTQEEREIIDTNQILLAIAHHWINTLEH